MGLKKMRNVFEDVDYDLKNKSNFKDLFLFPFSLNSIVSTGLEKNEIKKKQKQKVIDIFQIEMRAVRCSPRSPRYTAVRCGGGEQNGFAVWCGAVNKYRCGVVR